MDETIYKISPPSGSSSAKFGNDLIVFREERRKSTLRALNFV
jgi:hypothetical protein